MGETYFITGGAGNLACQLTFELARRGHRVVLFDLAQWPVAETAPGCESVRGDVTDAQGIADAVRRHQPDVILHFASLLSGKSEEDRPAAWRVNVDGTFALMESALAAGVGKFFLASSVATYGGRLPCPLPEDYPQWPDGLYGVTKMALERLGVYYHRKHGLDFRCLRLPMVISAYAPAGAASAYASRAFVEAVERGRFTFKVRPQTRPCVVYVKDALAAIVDLMETPAQRLSQRVYNIHGLTPSTADLAEAITARLPEAQLDFAPDPHIVALIESWPVEIADASARRDWGWQPQYDLEAMADDFIRELKHESANASGV